MEKPHTGLDECLRILLSYLRKMMSVLRGGKYLSHPFAVTMFESHVFWTDWRTNAVVRAGKFNGSDVHVEDKVLGGGDGGQPYDIRVMHRSRQPRYHDKITPFWISHP